MNIKRKFNSIDSHIEKIESITNKNHILFISKEDKREYHLLRKKNRLILKRKVFKEEMFKYGNIHLSHLNKKVFVYGNDTIYITNSLFSETDLQNFISFNIYKFETKNFKNKHYFQLIFKGAKKYPRLDFVFENLINVSTETFIAPRNGILFDIKNIKFNLYFVNQKFVIENIDKINFEEFDKYSKIIRLCFGLLTGYAPGMKGYYFAYENNKFEEFCEYAYSDSFADTYQTHLKPIDTALFMSFFPSTYSEVEREKLIIEYKNNLILISRKIFSNLCNLCLKENKIRRAIELIMEGNQTTIEAQGIVYSVVLENLTSYISSAKNMKSIKPIEKKATEREMKEKLHTVAKKYVDNYQNSAIKTRIDNINAPTNKDKLIKPFELLNITLNEEDKEIINHRNDFLHGNDFIKVDTLVDFTRKHVYINHKLHFLIHALLLKLIGHYGKILNIVKLYPVEGCIKCEDEEIYRDIGEKSLLLDDSTM